MGILALTGSALADTTVTASVGPVTIPGVPVQVCVVQTDVTPPVNECVTTPGAVTVDANVVVHVPTPAAAVTPPTITPVQCPAGTEGVALKVNTGGAALTNIGGTVVVNVLVDGVPSQQAISVGPIAVAGPNQTVTLFACAGVSPGV